MTPASGLLLRKLRTTERQKNVFPVPDSPAIAVILFEGIPPNKDPDTKALNIKLPVSTKVSTSPAVTPSETKEAYSFLESLITCCKKFIILLIKKTHERNLPLGIPSNTFYHIFERIVERLLKLFFVVHVLI